MPITQVESLGRAGLEGFVYEYDGMLMDSLISRMSVLVSILVLYALLRTAVI